ncbi:cytochrome P450 6d1-like [Aricia agestis]|uniref:cytochrome P450 6d1-like n=1 Tax=Aricia agestis TaxID=91739 RepID=UPI001C20A43A|nr:cytochrome P450 6d1-like [Aricia agestis]
MNFFHFHSFLVLVPLLIIISIDALHKDAQYFERPSEFWPERFADSGSKFEKDLYMPFGAGPRACIGERLGLLQSVAAVASILSKFTLSPSKSTVEKPTIDKNSIIAQNILGGLPLSLKHRNKID